MHRFIAFKSNYFKHSTYSIKTEMANHETKQYVTFPGILKRTGASFDRQQPSVLNVEAKSNAKRIKKSGPKPPS